MSHRTGLSQWLRLAGSVLRAKRAPKRSAGAQQALVADGTPLTSGLCSILNKGKSAARDSSVRASRRNPARRGNSLARTDVLETRVLPAIFTVTTTADSGPGSLRDAIEQANANAEADEINFDIGGGGVQTIEIQSALPQITDTLTIDGRHQPGYRDVPLIELDGRNVSGNSYGLHFLSEGSGSRVNAMSVYGFPQGEIHAQAIDSFEITASHIGTDSEGSLRQRAGGNGLSIFGGSQHVVGTDSDGLNDELEGNLFVGRANNLFINGGPSFETSDVVVAGNRFGATTDDPNTYRHGFGVLLVNDVVGTRIGGTRGVETNFFGNLYAGVQVGNRSSRSVTDTVIQGNSFGVDPGTESLYHNSAGIILERSISTVIGVDGDGVNDHLEWNHISNNTEHGIDATSGFSRISGNRIGTNAAGTARQGYQKIGIRFGGNSPSVIGTDADGISDELEGNLVSGHDRAGWRETAYGIVGNGTNNVTIAGNLVGTDISGMMAIPNTIGMSAPNAIVGGLTPVERNIISGNVSLGVGGTGITVIGNFVGTDATGVQALGNGTGISVSRNSTVGGGQLGARNVVSGNSTGIAASGHNVKVQNNYVGLGADGVTPVGNTSFGLNVRVTASSFVGTDGDGVNDETEGNIVVATGLSGIVGGATARGSGERPYISGNWIGVTPEGLVFPNQRHGVEAVGRATYSHWPMFLGPRPGSVNPELGRNVIAGNGRAGIHGRDALEVYGNYIGVLPDGTVVGNSGDGIEITYTSYYSSRVTIGDGTLENANLIQGNGGYGIGFVSADVAYGLGNIIRGNARGGIELLRNNSPGRSTNFPVVTSIAANGGQVVVEGFSRPGQIVELYESGPVAGGGGEGARRIFSLTEGSTDDLSDATGSYGPEVNGVAVGSDTDASQFRFVVDSAELSEGTRLATLGSDGPTGGMSGFSPSFLFGEFGSSLLPTIDLPDDATASNGILRVDGTFADLDSVSWSATVDYGDGSGLRPLVLDDNFHFHLEHDYATPGEYTVTVNITDNTLLTATETMTVTVENDTPEAAFYTFDLTNPSLEGETVTLTGEFFDELPSGNYVIDIDWGDGNTDSIPVDQAQRDFTAEHIYLDDNSFSGAATAADLYEVTVTVSEIGGGNDDIPPGVLVAEVRNALPTDVEASFSATSLVEGDTVTLDVSWFDAGVEDTHQVRINWGDGTTVQVVDVDAGVQQVSGLTHTYADDPFGDATTYDVTIEVVDDDQPLEPTTIVQPLTVTNPGPTDVVLNADSLTISETGIVTFRGSFVDPGTTDAHTLTFDFGDGSGTTNLDLEPGVTTFSGVTHQFLDDPATGSTFTVTVTIADTDNPEVNGQTTLDVTVNNVAPTIQLSDVVVSPTSGLEGDMVMITGSYNDISPRDRHTVFVDMGDGSVVEAVVDSTNRTFEATHIYDDNNTDGSGAIIDYPIAVTVTDDDGDSASITTSLSIVNVAPDVSILPTPGNNDVDSVELQGFVFDPGTADTLTYTWTASATGQTTQTLSGVNETAFILDRSVGPASLIWEVSLTVTDDDGESGSYVLDVQVGTSNPETITLNNASFGATPKDAYLILALGGNDIVDATAVTDPNINLILDGGSGNDTLLGGSGDDVYILADGNDAANTGVVGPGGLVTAPPPTVNTAGNDRYLLTPNSTLSVYDPSGDNELNFERSDFGITYDLSAVTTSDFVQQDVAPVSDPGSHFVRVQGSFNGLVGSASADDLTAADDSTVSSGAGDDTLRAKDGLTNATFNAGADDDILLVGPGATVSGLNFGGDDGLDSLINDGTIDGLTFTGGADDDILRNPGIITSTLNFGGDDGLDVLTNTGTIATLNFNGGADDDIFLNNGPTSTTLNFGGDDDILLASAGSVSTLNFGGDDGADIFANLGQISTLNFTGGADDDIFVNAGGSGTSLNFGGDEDVLLAGDGAIGTLNFGGDDGADTLINVGTVASLTFGGGADDDIFQNRGVISTSLNFGGDDGLDILTNTGTVQTLTFGGGADEDIFINSGPTTSTLNFGGDDEILLAGTGSVVTLNFGGDDGADSLVNFGAVTTLTFTGGADDDIFINNGPESASLNFGGDDEILLSGTGVGAVQTLNFNGDDGLDTLINAGTVTGTLTFSGGADDDIFINSGDSVAVLNFGGDDGADQLINRGLNIGTLNFGGDDGLDTLINEGTVSELTFTGGADEDILRNVGTITTSLNFGGDDGVDVLLNTGAITGLTFTGGADDDLLLNSGTVVGTLNFSGDCGDDIFRTTGTIANLNFGGGADDDLLLVGPGAVVSGLNFGGDDGLDTLQNLGTVDSLTFTGGADDDLLSNVGTVVGALNFGGDDGADLLVNRGIAGSLTFTGGADADSLLNLQSGLASLMFYGAGSMTRPMPSDQTDGDDLLVNKGNDITEIQFFGDDGADVLQNLGNVIATLNVMGGADDDVLLNSGASVASLNFTGDDGADILINTGMQIGTINFAGDSGDPGAVSGRDAMMLRGSGDGSTTATVLFDGGDESDYLHNFSTGFASITFEGRSGDDAFVNEASGATTIVFEGADGNDIFENSGNDFSGATFRGDDGFDIFVNTGNNVEALTFEGGADDDLLINTGVALSGLNFHGDEGADQFRNLGDDATNVTFTAGEGPNMFRNEAKGLTNFVFHGGNDVDTVINTDRGVDANGVTLNGAGGDDRFLNQATGARGLMLNGGPGADGFQNEGNSVNGLSFMGHGGNDVLINLGDDVSNLTFDGLAGDDSFRNEGRSLQNASFYGGDGNDAAESEGDGLSGFLFAGDEQATGSSDDFAGFDRLFVLGADIGAVTFAGGPRSDVFENYGQSTDVVTFLGGDGNDEARNHGTASRFVFQGDDGSDRLTNTADNIGVFEFHGGANGDSLMNRGDGIGSLIATGGDGNDAFRILGSATNVSITDDLGNDSAEVFSSGHQVTVNLGSGRDSLIVMGDNSSVTANTGTDDDSLLFGGSGTMTVDGGTGSDTYFLTGNKLTSLNIVEASEGGTDNSSDTLDFSAFTAGGISLNLGSTEAQTFAGLTLTLSDGLGIENVIGTTFDDTISGNARDNFLSGADLTEPFEGTPVAPKSDVQWVYLDFTSATDEGEHEYDAGQVDAIMQRLADIYHGPDAANPWFAIEFTTDAAAIPVTEFITVTINETPPSGRPGGLASDIDPGNRRADGVAVVQVNGMLGGIISEDDAVPNHDHGYGEGDHDHGGGHDHDEPHTHEEIDIALISTDVIGSLKPAASKANFAQLTSKIIAHEVAHLLGTRHQDSFGPIGFGINVFPGNDSFAPNFPGPASALETFRHVGGSPASVGSTRFDDLEDLYFGEREAIKLTAAFSDPAAIHFAEQTTDHSTISTAQMLTPALLDVPNTVQGGINSGDEFSVQFVSLLGSIDPVDASAGAVSESDYYSFSASAGDIVTIEVMSNSIVPLDSGADFFIDSILRVYDEAGNLVPYHGSVAVNDDVFEPTDSVLMDLRIQQDGTYYIEVDTFGRAPGDPLGDPTNPNSPLNPANTNNILDEPELLERFLDSLNDTDTGNYQLMMYNFRDISGSDGTNIIRGYGGEDTILGAAENDYTAPVSEVVDLPATYGSKDIVLSITSDDPDDGGGTPSGVASLDIYVAIDQNGWNLWQTVPGDTTTITYPADSSHRYWFRAVATDGAGNVEEDTGVPETYTWVGDFDAPETAVVTATANDSGLITLTATGSDIGGGDVESMEFFVSIDGAAPVSLGTASSTADGAGGFQSEIIWQAPADGVSRTFEFYSSGTDDSGNAEATPSAADATLTGSWTTGSDPEATGIDVQNGVNQRSFIRYVDLLFADDTGLQDLIDGGHVRVEKFAIDTTDPAVGTGAAVAIAASSVTGNSIRFDFGAAGLGGNARSTAGNGFYRISVDSDQDGTFDDQHFEFHRLLGDANGDGEVSNADVSTVMSQYGQRGSKLNGDITGDGVVNVLDRLFVLRNRGTKLDDDLLGWLDD